jgi:predicted ATPase/class 3 adenylate cyclase
MDFYDVLDHVVALLQRRGRVTYNALKLQFYLDDEQLAVLKDELLYAHPQVVDDVGRGLRWTGDPVVPQAHTPPALQHAPQPIRPADSPPQDTSPRMTPRPPEAERRQLTVLFCDLADSTRLASQLDPEDLREVVLAYQTTCAEIIQRFDGYIAQYLGDGLLVYFGYPQAHEDDAQRAVRASLGILDAMGRLNTRLEQHQGVRLAVRVGIHTGPVVVGTMGSGGRYEQLALGETPNLAARLQSLAAPDMVAISEATHRLVQGYFRCDDLGSPSLKGIETPMRVYRVVEESAAQSRLDVIGAAGLTPLVGREHEVGLLRERWAQSRDGLGQVVLLSGEAGIGKSRLVRVLTERVADEGAPWLTLRCSPYHTNSAFSPVIEHLQRLLQWHRHETPAARLAALEQALQTAGLPLAEVVSLLAALLSLPVPEQYPPLALSPQRQKQKTQEALVAWLLAETAQQPVLAVWEDLHWADPSTLELLDVMLDHAPTTRLLLVLTTRPEFHPPWTPRSYVTQLTLPRLPRHQSEDMVLRVTGGKPMPAEVLAQIVAKTDGIPLFVEELVKTILEAGLVQEDAGRYVLTGPLPPLAIPATLQDALMARLDRLSVVKDVAQLGAVLGREFAYELLRAVALLDEVTLQQALAQLVGAELLYQRGVPPQATYVFKHALIQDTAYQSLLKSTRQQYHQRIAQVLTTRFPEMVERQPEVAAHHYTEAGLNNEAIDYWQRAGQQALQRSAYAEAMSHLTIALDLLTTLPESRARSQQELVVQMTLGIVLRATKGQAAPEVERLYTHAHELCERVGEPLQRFRVLWGLWMVYSNRGEYHPMLHVGEQLLSLAERLQDPDLLLEAHHALWASYFLGGELATARPHFEQGLRLYAPQRHHTHAALYSGHDPGVCCHQLAAPSLWLLGYPDQAVANSQAALALAQQLAHPYTLTLALYFAAMVHHLRRDVPLTQARAEALMTVATDQEFPLHVAQAMPLRGWTLTENGQGEEGIAQIHQGLAAYQATGATRDRPYYLALLAEASAKVGQTTEGLEALAEALATLAKSGVPWWEAELYRLRGELLLSADNEAAAEACFHQALDIAPRRQARSLELRAAMSLARLWQRQGKHAEAYQLLTPIYGWFTEGFDTADLKEAKALLDELESH